MSTTTTAHVFDKENSGKYSNIKGFKRSALFTSQVLDEETVGEDESHSGTPAQDSNLSPPLARQLFSKHELFGSEEQLLHNDELLGRRNKWFDTEETSPDNQNLKPINEDPESSHESSLSKFC